MEKVVIDSKIETEEVCLAEEEQKSISEVLRFYNQEVQMWISTVERVTKEYPIAILNEIRAAMGHISDCYYLKNRELIKINCDKAQGHLRRGLFDCLKYLWYHYDVEIENLIKQFKYADFTIIHDGEFNKELNKRIKESKLAFKFAQNSENLGSNQNNNEVYDKYKDAVLKAKDVIDYFIDEIPYIQHLNRKTLKMKVVGFLGWAVALVVTIFFGIMSIL